MAIHFTREAAKVIKDLPEPARSEIRKTIDSGGLDSGSVMFLAPSMGREVRKVTAGEHSLLYRPSSDGWVVLDVTPDDELIPADDADR